MEAKKTKVYIYTRVSTDMQVDGYSLEAQKEKLNTNMMYMETSQKKRDMVQMEI